MPNTHSAPSVLTPFLFGGGAAALVIGVSMFFDSRSSESGARNLTPDLVAIEAALEDLSSRVAQLEEGPAPAVAAASVGRTEVAMTSADVTAIVEGMLAERDARGLAVTNEEALAAEPFDTRASVDQLIELGVLGGDATKVWAQLDDDGRVDDVLAAFKSLAENSPGSADAQASLGAALIAKLQFAKNQAEISTLALSADASFDDALKIDPEHWEARFTKAISYTSWPEFTGKPAQAIEHFETLIEQQNRKAVRPEFAETFVQLGRMHAARGNADKARQVWQQGASQFPEHSELRKLLSGQ